MNKKLNKNILSILINAFKEDENLKKTYFNNFIKSIKIEFSKENEFKSKFLSLFSKELNKVREKVKEEMEKLPLKFNILDSIRRKNLEGRLLTYEPYNSNLLCQLLKINFKYKECEKEFEVNFAKLFLEFMNKKFKNKIDLNNIHWENVEAKNEYKKIDVLIRYKKSFAVIIENKIGYHDRDRQLETYYNTMLEEGYGNNIYIIYLTPYGYNPKEKSLKEEDYKKESGKLYGKFANIRHAEIGYWLEGILKRQEFSFLNNEEENNKYNYKLLKSALIQIIDNEKSISGENKERDDMIKDEIKELLEKNLFKEIKTVDKAQEYIDMFNKANELLGEHKKLIVKNRILPYLDFTRKIYNELENKDVYTLLTDTEIIDNILGGGSIGGYSHNLEFEKKGVYLMIEIATDDLGGKYYFGIFTGEPKFQNKLREKTNEIKKIFNRFCIDYNFRDCEGAWVYYYHIDINNDKPEDIADAINKLYEFLKIEIR